LFGVSSYWVAKSFFVWIFPLAWLAVLPLARVIDRVPVNRQIAGPSIAAAFAITALVLAAVVLSHFPPPFASPLSESDIQVAQWAREHLDTYHVNYISRRGLVPQWLGVGF
jgi:hypothetical protein